MKPLLSVIITVYNAESLISVCLDSFLRQRDFFSYVEVVIVNDGSTDNSDFLLRSYIDRLSSRYSIRYVSQNNGGIGVARDRGLSLVTGEFVSFVDIDDYVSDDYVSTICDFLIKNPCVDIVELCAFSFFDNKEIKNVLHKSREGYHGVVDLQLLESLMRERYWYAWSKVVRKILFEGVVFGGLRCFEDLMVYPFIYIKARFVFSLERPVYYYRYRADSLSNSVSSEQVMLLVSEIKSKALSVGRCDKMCADFPLLLALVSITSSCRSFLFGTLAPLVAYREYRGLWFHVKKSNKKEVPKIVLRMFSIKLWPLIIAPALSLLSVFFYKQSFFWKSFRKRL